MKISISREGLFHLAQNERNINLTECVQCTDIVGNKVFKM